MNFMPPSALLELQNQLPRMMGLHKWVLNFQTGRLRLEFGRQIETARSFDFDIDKLGAMLGPDDMKIVAAHWEEAVQEGFSGPTRIPFVLKEGNKVSVESVCGLHRGGDHRSLVGIFRRLSQPAPSEAAAGKSEERPRRLFEYLESFIVNSPSCIVVADGHGTIITANREFLRFIGKSQRADVVRQIMVDTLSAFNAGLGDVAREAMRATRPLQGKYEVVQRSGARQTIYWRTFSLGVDQTTAPPKVFAFEPNPAGPRTS